jgi:dihydroxy-acid dehydratase
LAEVADYPDGQVIILPFDKPIKKDSHLVVLSGNLAPQGAVSKITGKEGLSFTGTDKVYDPEEQGFTAIMDGQVVAGDVVVIRYERPRGGAGMRDTLSPTAAIMGKGLGNDVALIINRRFSGGSRGFVVEHITPETYEGGAIVLIKNGKVLPLMQKIVK